MLPASNRGVGMNICFPDVCLTPPVGVPVPYVNLGMNATAVPFAFKTFFSCVNALNMGSQVPLTLGDQAGAMSPFMGSGRVSMGNPKVIVEALPGSNLCCPASGNNFIAAIGAVLVPSVTNVLFSYAGERPAGRVSAAELSGLARALVPAPGEHIHALLPGNVGYASIPVFASDTPARLYDAVRRLSAASLRALILDLRHCPGGDLMAAVALAGDFLDEGTVIARIADEEGDETVVRAQQAPLYAFPVAVLVDRHTASAAEVFAAALQANGRASVIGERTLGKGSAQAVLAGIEPGAHYANVATVLLPGGEPLDGRGVCPDIEADPAPATPTAADLASNEAIVAHLEADPALRLALEAWKDGSRLPQQRVEASLYEVNVVSESIYYPVLTHD